MTESTNETSPFDTGFAGRVALNACMLLVVEKGVAEARTDLVHIALGFHARGGLAEKLGLSPDEVDSYMREAAMKVLTNIESALEQLQEIATHMRSDLPKEDPAGG